jgi:hypothetical protein
LLHFHLSILHSLNIPQSESSTPTAHRRSSIDRHRSRVDTSGPLAMSKPPSKPRASEPARGTATPPPGPSRKVSQPSKSPKFYVSAASCLISVACQCDR